MTKAASYLLRGGQIVTMNPQREVFQGDLLIVGSRIEQIAHRIKPSQETLVVDVTDHFVIPGLIQAHTHLVQTLSAATRMTWHF